MFLTIGPILLAICVLFLLDCPYLLGRMTYFCLLATANTDFRYTNFFRHILRAFIIKIISVSKELRIPALADVNEDLQDFEVHDWRERMEIESRHSSRPMSKAPSERGAGGISHDI